MKRFEALLLSVLLPSLLILCWSSVAKADGVFLRQTITTHIDAKVNDARVEFDGEVTAGNLTNNTMKANGVVTSKKTLTFAQGTFGTMNNLDRAFVDFAPTGDKGATKVSGGTWTIDGADAGEIIKIGAPMRLAFNSSTNEASAIFFNPESFSITYSSIMLYANNNLVNFNLDQFFIPTGLLIAGPSSMTLAPGESFTLSFGVVDLSQYQLALAQVAMTSNPNDLFDVASAAGPVPEPTTILLLSTGLAGVAINTRKRFKSRKSGQGS